MKRKSIHKKLLSLLLCACMVLGTVFVEGAITKQSLSQVEAAEVGENVNTVRKDLVFDSKGYENATTYAVTSDTHSTLHKIAGDVTLIEEQDNTDNNVLWYRHNWYAWGEIVLGHDYKSNTITSPVKVEAGKTYAVTYDYKILGATGDTNLEIGVAIFDELFTADGSTKNRGNDAPETLAKDFSIEQTLAKGTAPTTTEWQTHTAYITIPEDCNYEGSYLVLFMRKGNQANTKDEDGDTVLNGVFFDNISVETLAEYDETILSYNDYETATASEPGSYYQISGNAFPKMDPADSDNQAIFYNWDWSALGVISLKDEYIDNQLDTYIAAEAGSTYRITYDWKTTGTATSEATIGVGLATVGDGKESVSETILFGDTPEQQTILSIPSGSGTEYVNWQTTTVYYTVPADYTDTVYNRLMLYVKGGGLRELGIYFDNITVAKVNGVSVCSTFVDTQMSYNDYTTVNTNNLSETGGRSGKYFQSSRDVSPTRDMIDSTNIVLGYYHHYKGLGVIPLGYDYTTTGALTDNYVKAEAGVSYKIEYDYYIKGTPTSSMKMGVAVGNPVLATEDDKTGAGVANYFTDYVADSDDIESYITNQKYDTNWVKKTIYYTVPKDCDVSVKNALQLWITGGANNGDDVVHVYFDNITVTKLAGANVDYVVDGAVNTDISGYTSDGMVHNEALTNDDGATIKWYTDKEFTQPVTFTDGLYDVGTTFAEKTVYGKWSPVVKYYINQHLTGSTLPYDGITKSYDVESASLDDLTAVIAGTAAEGKLDENLSFDGWYSVTKVGNDYSFDKKVTTVAEAMAAGGVYAKYTRANSTTTTYDIAGPASSETANTYYDNFMSKVNDGTNYSMAYLADENQWVLKCAYNTYPSGQKSFVIANPTSGSYGWATAVKESSYASLQLDTAYKVTLKYKVTEKPTNPMEIALCTAPVNQYWMDSNKHELVKVATVDDVTDGWQEATAYFTADVLRDAIVNDTTKSTGRFADALAITTYGVGEIYYDDITVTALSKADYESAVTAKKLNFAVGESTNAGVTTFDDVASFTYDKQNQTIQMKSDNYQPKITGFKVNGSKVYESANDEGTAFNATYNTTGATSIEVSLYNKLDCDNTSNFSVVATSGGDSDSMRFLLRTYSDYQDFGYFGNEAYAVVDRGVLVALTDYAGYTIDAETLVPDVEGVQKVSCMNGLYSEKGIFYDYTVDVDGITEIFKDKGVIVRGYMTLSNGNTEFTVLTDNAITNSLNDVSTGNMDTETFYDAQVDEGLILSETGITSVTLALYDDGDADIYEYGVTWITDARYENNVIQVIEAGGSFDTPDTTIKTVSDINVTPYDSHFLKEGYNYQDYSAGKHGAYSTWDTYNEVKTRYSNKGVISGLESGKVYKYRVGYQNAEGKWNYSYIGTITTPDASKADEFTFAYMADSQQSFKKTGALAKTLKTMMKNNTGIEFIAHGGDIINYNSYEKQWNELLDANKQYFMSIPFMPASGNHEYNMVKTVGYDFHNHFNMYAPSSAEGTAAERVNGYSGTYYSYDYKNVHFVVLNTNEGYVTGLSNDYKLTDAQVNWLKEDLGKAKQDESIDYTIVYMHCGLYMTGAFGSESGESNVLPGKADNAQSLVLREQLGQIFYDNGVDLVMNGHDHIYSVTNVLDGSGNPVADQGQGVVYMTGAVAGAEANPAPKTDTDDQYPKDAANGVYASVIDQYLYCWTELSVTGNGIQVTTYTADTGTTGAACKELHSFNITKNNVGNTIPADGTVIGSN